MDTGKPDKPTTKRKGGRTQLLTVPEIASAIAKHDGNIASIARKFGVARITIYDYVSKSEELQHALNEARETMKDDAESALYKAVRNGESWAVCFFLKTQAKDRGYRERSGNEPDQSGDETELTRQAGMKDVPPPKTMPGA